MLAEVTTSSVLGLNAFIVKAEIDSSLGIGKHVTVGLPDTAVKEGRERIEAAIKNSHFEVSFFKRITVNLAPADIRKEGPIFDLPIAVGILATERHLHPDHLKEKVIIGELSLNGGVHPVKGVLSIALKAAEKGFKEIIVPKGNAREASMIKTIRVIAVESLKEAVDHLTSTVRLDPYVCSQQEPSPQYFVGDFSEVKGQYSAKRALEIAAAGGHNVLMMGSPGCGKTMLAKRFPSILPPLTYEEAIEVSRIYSVAGLLREGLISRRPFRSPHHTISDAGMAGGGTIPRPGEISLAHLGVLFLDEFPEFSRQVLEALRQPLEDGEVTIARALVSLSYPAKFCLISAMNPCPCGFLMDRKKECVCQESHLGQYWKKISGPILDRIDIMVEVPSLTPDELDKTADGETSEQIRLRVGGARILQQNRFSKIKKIYTNSDLTPKLLHEFCKLDPEAKTILKKTAEKMNLSARSYDRIIKVARTIADLEESRDIAPSHISEAIQLRLTKFPHAG